MAPRTRKPVAKRRKNHLLRDGDGMEEHGQQQNEQEPDWEASRQPIQKQVMARSTRSATSRNTLSVILDKLQAMENQQGMQPQIFPQASMEQVMDPRTRKTTGYHGLEEMDQMEGDRQHQNEEELEFQMTQQTHSRQVTAPRSQRSSVNRRQNNGYMEQDALEEHGQQEYGRHTNLEVSDALKNALQILMASGSQRATTNPNSYNEFQDNHQRQENGQWQHKRQIAQPISQQASVMTPTTRKATGDQLGYHRLQDEVPIIEGDGEKQRDFQMTQQVMAPRTRRAIANSNSNSGFRDKKMKENEQLHNRKQVQPQISHEDSMLASRSWRATTNQSGYHRLRDEDRLERDRQHQNEEEPEFLTTRQTKNQQVMSHSTRRSTPGRRVNDGLLDDDEIEDHGQRENEQVSDMEVTQAIENALHILMAPSTRRETTNENSHCGFQDMHQMKESRQQQSMQRPQPRQVSQQASISAVMPPKSQNASRSHCGFQDMHQMKESRQQQSMQQLQPQVSQQASISAVMPPRSQNTTRTHCGFQDMHQTKESRQKQSMQGLQPQVSQQASISTVMPPRSQNATRNQSGHHSHRLCGEDQMDGDEEQKYEEPPEIQMAQQANGLVATMATNESAGIRVDYKDTQSARTRRGKEELCSDDDADRTNMWKKAQVPKNGEIEKENLKKTAQRVDYIRQKEEGEFKTQRLGEDLLACALKSREHSGRVRAIGSYVTPSMFFKHVKKRRQYLRKEQLVDLMEAKKQIAEQNEMICHLHDKLSKLEASIAKDKENEKNRSFYNKQPNHLMDEDLEKEAEEKGADIVEKVDTLQVLDVISPKNKRVQHQVVQARKAKCYDSLHPMLKVLSIHAKNSLSKGQGTIFISFDDHAFGKPFELFILFEDVIPFCELEPITRNCIVVYMWYLYKKLKDNCALDLFCFVDPFDVSCVTDASHDAQPRALADRFENVSSNQLVIVPFNVGIYWILTVIDPCKGTISVFDPLDCRVHDGSWKNIANMAFSMFNAKLKKRGKKLPTWEIMKLPRPSDSEHCGFFIMRYMKEIVEELMTSGSICLRSHFENKVYTQEDIDEVRVEWANLVLDHI